MIQAAIEFFFIFWYYLAEILLIERILKTFFGIDPHSKKVHHIVFAHILQIALVILVIWGLIIFYLTFIRFGLYI